MTTMLFNISFFKNLADSTGHPRHCCQGEVEVQAADEAGAIEIARQRFAASKHVTDWSLFADYEVVELSKAMERADGTPV
jgi:hypothetical protein